MSIGITEELNFNYLKKLKSLIEKCNPPWFSDHVCWTGHNGHHMHNLLPLPFTEEVADYIVAKIKVVQDYMERPFLLENVSSYMEFTNATMTEWDFLSYIAENANCGLLLDVNNVYVSSKNHEFDPMTFLKNLPKERVIQYHIAGHTNKGSYLMDTHDHDICDDVWALFEKNSSIIWRCLTTYRA